MPKKTVALDYARCEPARCDQGVCAAALECEHSALKQDGPYELPEMNPSKWCHGCAKCARACPLKAIRVL